MQVCGIELGALLKDQLTREEQEERLQAAGAHQVS